MGFCTRARPLQLIVTMSEPRLKKIRRLGTDIPGLTRKRTDRRPYPPGQHGQTRQRRKVSEYRRRLEEKQKVKLNYNLSERQMRRYFRGAAHDDGVTGDALFSALEKRLSNAVFRSGMAVTERSARQLVSHGHILVDGTRVDRPGYSLSVGQTVELAHKMRENVQVLESVQRPPQVQLPSYITRTDEGFLFRIQSEPLRADVPFIVDDRAIIEFYAR